MANVGLPPLDAASERVGTFITLIVLAKHGCNLKCRVCFIDQRKETALTVLRPEHLERFITQAAERSPVYGIAIQGHEPLLADSEPYTRAILSAAHALDLPTSVVTNGTMIGDRLALLRDLPPDKIGISLDAARPAIHDRLRGVEGAWQKTIEGMEIAVRSLQPESSLAAISILIPSRSANLDGMPQLLADLGLSHWIVNPLTRVGRDRAGGIVGDRLTVLRDMLRLCEASAKAGIRLTIDDEFDCLQHGRLVVDHAELADLPVRVLPKDVQIFRLNAGGECTFGIDILRQNATSVPRWRPHADHAGTFLSQLQASASAGREHSIPHCRP